MGIYVDGVVNDERGDGVCCRGRNRQLLDRLSGRRRSGVRILVEAGSARRGVCPPWGLRFVQGWFYLDNSNLFGQTSWEYKQQNSGSFYMMCSEFFLQCDGISWGLILVVRSVRRQYIINISVFSE